LNRENLSPNETKMPDSLSVIYRMKWEAKAGTGCWCANPTNLPARKPIPNQSSQLHEQVSLLSYNVCFS